MKKTVVILTLLMWFSASAWADRKAEGDRLYLQFARWNFENNTDSILARKDEAMAFFADNWQWEHYYFVANLAVQVELLHDGNVSACLRECQKLYKFATDHFHDYGRASVQAQMGWIFGYIGDHQEAVRQLRESIASFRRLKAENAVVVSVYYIYAYMLELIGDYDEQQRIIDEGKRLVEKLRIGSALPEVNELVADQLMNTEALMKVHSGRLDEARPLIGQIQQKLADGKERSVYEAYRAIAEYQLASGDYRHALETTRRMERELKGVQNSGLQWGLNLLRTEILRKLGHSDEAYDTLRAMVDRRNSASVSRLRRQLSEMDSQYQIDEMRIQEQKSHFWWAVSVSLIIIIGLAVFAYFRQCTARLLARKNKELADALARAQESDRMKTAFVQHISHEIRTPLNIITGFAQVIGNPDFEVSTEDRNRMLADISRNTNEITTFVNELLELSESESQHPYEQNDDVDISALCQQVVGETDNSARLQITVESHLPEGYTLRSNADALHKILTRLMSNAVKFTSQGSVTLRLTPLGDRLRIEVEDTGIGIPQEHQEKVFERFYKVDTFRQGIGLGLTVARRSAELLGGTLAIDPAYTAGARFVLTV